MRFATASWGNANSTIDWEEDNNDSLKIAIRMKLATTTQIHPFHLHEYKTFFYKILNWKTFLSHKSWTRLLKLKIAQRGVGALRVSKLVKYCKTYIGDSELIL